MDRTTLSLDQIKSLLPGLPDRKGFSDRLYLCKTGPLTGQFAVDTIWDPAIDEQSMTVRMRISTAELDRVNHVVDQDGIQTDFYRDNPVVLFGHGMEGITLPVAVSEDEQGALTIARESDGTYAVAHHLGRNKLSSQFFDLVVQKFLRSSSIGITPTKCSKGYDSRGEEILFIDQGQLNEWSYCTIGINPGARIVKCAANFEEIRDLQSEAASRILLADRLDGSSIHPLIRKSLQASLLTKVTSPGLGPKTEANPMPNKRLSAEEVQGLKLKPLAKCMLELSEYDEPTQALLKAAWDYFPEDPGMAAASGQPFPQGNMIPGAMDPARFGDPGAGPTAGQPDEAEGSQSDLLAPEDDTPLGARVMRSIYENLLNLIEVSTKALGPVEAPEVKQATTELLDQLRDLATSMEGVFSGKYPDQPGLASLASEPTDEVVKGFLASSTRGKDQLQGLAARLDMVAKGITKNTMQVSPTQLKLLTRSVSDLQRLGAAAKAFVPPVKPEPPAIDQQRIAEEFSALQTQFASLVEALGAIPMPIESSGSAGA